MHYNNFNYWELQMLNTKILCLDLFKCEKKTKKKGNKKI